MPVYFILTIIWQDHFSLVLLTFDLIYFLTVMLGNLKEFISVVQDGLTSNNNLRQTLQEVQKVKNIFKDKQKVTSESKVNYGAGSALLEKYQEQWAELHENADKNARAAEEVDKLIIELHEVTKARLQSATELAQNLAHLPNLTVSVAQCIDSLKNVQTLLTDVEDQLVDFEDIVERSNMEKWKLDHHYHLTLYKEKKMGQLYFLLIFKNNSDLGIKLPFGLTNLRVANIYLTPKCLFW